MLGEFHEHPETKSVNVGQQSTEISLILGNSNSNFSGVTSTMLQVAAEQKKRVNLRVMGRHHLPDPKVNIGFWQTIRLCRKPLSNGKWRIFHARRVDEMIQALTLRYVFGCKIKMVFSSAAQRKRSDLTVWLTRRMDAVVAVSQRSASYLADPPDVVIPHGVKTELFQPHRDKTRAWQALGYGGQVGIGILGRVRQRKGVHHFVRACIEILPQHDDVTALVIGAISPPNLTFADGLKMEIEAIGLSGRIVFTDELPFERIPPIFSALSVVAALSENEGFGLTVLEAMSSEAAVLATDAGAWKEVIRENVDGHVVAVDDYQAIRDRLGDLLDDRHKIRTMGQAGRERVLQDYRIEQEAAQLLEFFETLQ